MSAPVDPPWLAHARTLIGTREIPGSKHSPVIMDWIRKLGAKVLGINVVDDETPWCGTFMAWLMRQAGLNTPPIAVRASSWGLYGRGLLNPRLGCIMVFTRSGGGHVGLYVGEDAGAYPFWAATSRTPSRSPASPRSACPPCAGLMACHCPSRRLSA